LKSVFKYFQVFQKSANLAVVLMPERCLNSCCMTGLI